VLFFGPTTANTTTNDTTMNSLRYYQYRISKKCNGDFDDLLWPLLVPLLLQLPPPLPVTMIAVIMMMVVIPGRTSVWQTPLHNDSPVLACGNLTVVVVVGGGGGTTNCALMVCVINVYVVVIDGPQDWQRFIRAPCERQRGLGECQYRFSRWGQQAVVSTTLPV
jgi:hypothetical protein